MKEFGVWIAEASQADRIEIMNILACNGIRFSDDVFYCGYKRGNSLHAYPDNKHERLKYDTGYHIQALKKRYDGRLAFNARDIESLFEQEKR